MDARVSRDLAFERYASTSHRIDASLDQVRQDLNYWLEQNRDHSPRITEIARLEALHAERTGLVAELLQAEKQFMDFLIGNLKSTAD